MVTENAARRLTRKFGILLFLIACTVFFANAQSPPCIQQCEYQHAIEVAACDNTFTSCQKTQPYDVCLANRDACYSEADKNVSSCEFACGSSGRGGGGTGGGGRGRTSCTGCAANMRACLVSGGGDLYQSCIASGGTQQACCQLEEDSCLRTCVP